MIVVDIDNFHAAARRPEREGIIRLDCLIIVNGAFPVAVVELGRSNEWEETRRIDDVHELLDGDLNIVTELFINIRNAASHARHHAQDLGAIWWILAKRPM